jgi:hypothetical protein
MPRPERKDLSTADGLLAPGDPGDPAEAEPEPSQFDDEPDEHNCSLHGEERRRRGRAGASTSRKTNTSSTRSPPTDDTSPSPTRCRCARSDPELTEDERDLEEPTEEEGPATAWDEELEDAVGGASENEWAELEHEGQLLAPGRVVVGYKEFVSFPDEGVSDLQACCDTGEPRSILYGTSEPLGGGMFRLSVGDHVMEAKGSEEDAIFVRAPGLGGASRRVAFK